MAAEIDALGVIADQIVRPNPLDLATWVVDFSPCLPVVKVHLQTWIVDVSKVHPCQTSLSD
jgi:hypothetical protein